MGKPEAVVEFDITEKELKAADDLGDIRLPDPTDLSKRNPVKIPVTD